MMTNTLKKNNMAFKMKSGNKVSFKNMGSSPAKQKDNVVIEGKTYPKGYTKKDVKFLKEQREDVVRREDLDEKGKAIWDAQRAKKKKKSPTKQTIDQDKVKIDRLSRGEEIKSKTQIKQDYKTAKTKSKTDPRGKGDKRDYTAKERHTDKRTMLDARLKRHTQLEAEGEGEKGFSWKEAGKSVLRGEGLMGNIASGIGKGRDKSKIVKDKIAKHEGKKERKDMQKYARAEKKVTRKEARATKRAERKARLAKNIDISAG